MKFPFLDAMSLEDPTPKDQRSEEINLDKNFVAITSSWKKHDVDIPIDFTNVPKEKPRYYLLPILREFQHAVKSNLIKVQYETERALDLKLPEDIDIITTGQLYLDTIGSIPKSLEPGFAYNFLQITFHNPNLGSHDYFMFAQTLPEQTVKITLFPDANFYKLMNPNSTYQIFYICNAISFYRMFSACQLEEKSPLLEQINSGRLQPLELHDEALQPPTTQCLIGLNKNQENAVTNIIKSKGGVSLVQGPPGTGKTTMLITALKALITLGKKSYVTAPSNRAVLEILTRFLQKDSTTPVIFISSNEILSETMQDISLHIITSRAARTFNHFQKLITNLAKENIKWNEQTIITSLNLLKTIIVNIDSRFAIFTQEMEEINDTISKILIHVETLKELNNKQQEQDTPKKLENIKEQILRAINMIERLTSLNNKAQLAKKILDHCQIFFSTLSASAELILNEVNNPPSYFFIDEAAFAITPDIYNLLNLTAHYYKDTPQHFTMIGDPRQLPAVITAAETREYMGVSLMEQLMLNTTSCPTANFTLLTMQYRMHKEIRAFPSERYYNSLLVDAEDTRSPLSESIDTFLDNPYVVIDITGNNEKFNPKTMGFSNEKEIWAAADIIRYLRTQNCHEEIGIITFYAEQVNQFNEKFKKLNTGKLHISTIDSFQGGEYDIIIISCVRSNNKESSNLDFISNEKRLTVALTRARRHLYLLGDRSTLEQKHNEFLTLFTNAEKRNVLFTHSDLEIASPYESRQARKSETNRQEAPTYLWKKERDSQKKQQSQQKPQAQKKNVCRFFNGKPNSCTKGEACTFLHQTTNLKKN